MRVSFFGGDFPLASIGVWYVATAEEDDCKRLNGILSIPGHRSTISAQPCLASLAMLLTPAALAGLLAAVCGGGVIPVPTGDTLERLLCNGGAGRLAVNTTLMLAAGTHALRSTCNVTDPSPGLRIVGVNTSNITTAMGLGGGSVISGAYTVPRSLWKEPGDVDGVAAAGIWTAALPPNTWPPGADPPQQLWIDGGATGRGGVRARRIRARHPDLLAADGASVIEAPYMYWAAELCPMSQPAMAHCTDKGCHAPGCNSTFCAPCWELDRQGLRYNATADGALMARLAAANPGANGVGPLQAVVYHGWTASRHYVAFINPVRRGQFRAVSFVASAVCGLPVIETSTNTYTTAARLSQNAACLSTGRARDPLCQSLRPADRILVGEAERGRTALLPREL